MLAAALGLVGAVVPASARVPGAGHLEVQEIALADAGRAAATSGWTKTVGVRPGTQMVDLTWSGAPSGAVRVRIPDGRGGWGEWNDYRADPDEGPDAGGNGRSGVGPLFLAPGGVGRVQVQVRSGKLADLRLAASRWVAPKAGSGAGAEAAGPAIHPRAEWAPGPWRPDKPGCTKAPEVMSQLRFVVVHHTDQSNAYRPADVPGILAATYRFHVNGRGWCDIAYNFLIDRFGGVWQGRSGAIDLPILGGHAKGFNTDSVGIALIGQHQTGERIPSAAPSAAALLALRRTVAWKLSIHGLDATSSVRVVSNGSTKYPKGRVVVLPRIQGHGDSSYTTCPGNRLRAGFAALRAGVAADLRATASPATWKPFTSGQAFFGQLGVDARGRTTNAEAAQRTSQVVREKRTVAAVADEALASALVDDRIGLSARLYRAFNQLWPDTAALTALVAQRDKGVKVDAIAAELGASPAFAARYGSLGDADLVRALYRDLLGREAQPGEVADGERRLATGTTRSAFVLRVADSPEHKARVLVESNVQSIWFALLRRSPTSSELSSWSSRIRGGTPSVTAVAGLLASDEYLRRFPRP